MPLRRRSPGAHRRPARSREQMQPIRCARTKAECARDECSAACFAARFKRCVCVCCADKFLTTASAISPARSLPCTASRRGRATAKSRGESEFAPDLQLAHLPREHGAWTKHVDRSRLLRTRNRGLLVSRAKLLLARSKLEVLRGPHGPKQSSEASTALAAASYRWGATPRFLESGDG
ncbi:hypothetical protein T492DRAFT_83039 [Pavlovales sp. CCMP2436]|nr:hypothetical protein T492DRAFT_83039 [Pavlovales sp. CCMP2436]